MCERVAFYLHLRNVVEKLSFLLSHAVMSGCWWLCGNVVSAYLCITATSRVVDAGD